MTTKLYRLRADGDDDQKVIQFLKKHSTRYLLVHHVLPTGNPHYHAYVETHLTQGNLSNYVKKELGVSKGDYSNKTCSEDRKHEYLSYLFNTKKGNQPRYVSSEEFSLLDIKTYQDNAKTIAEEFQQRMTENGKKTQFEIVEIVALRLANKVLLPEVIYEELIEVLKATRTVARPNHVRDMIYCVMAYYGHTAEKERARGIALKFFSQY